MPTVSTSLGSAGSGLNADRHRRGDEGRQARAIRLVAHGARLMALVARGIVIALPIGAPGLALAAAIAIGLVAALGEIAAVLAAAVLAAAVLAVLTILEIAVAAIAARFKLRALLVIRLATVTGLAVLALRLRHIGLRLVAAARRAPGARRSGPSGR